jgi:hypothetical protein
MSKFKKCILCGAIASYKVWLRNTETNKRYPALPFCKICYDQDLEENKDLFGFMEPESNNNSERIMMILRKTVRI